MSDLLGSGGFSDAGCGTPSAPTTLVRAGIDLVTVAELLVHSRVETVCVYSKPTTADKVKALEHLAVDD